MARVAIIKVVSFLFALALVFFLVTTSLRVVINSGIYEFGFDRYRVSESTGLSRAELTVVFIRGVRRSSCPLGARNE